jgi:Fe2+ or Zn2+ uptake regulation protein
MNTVACGIRPSIHAAYQSQKEQMNVSVTSVYNKLNGLAALRSVHGIEKIEQEVSNYYLVPAVH